MNRKTLVVAAFVGALGLAAVGCEEKKPAAPTVKPPPAPSGTTGAPAATGSTAAPK